MKTVLTIAGSDPSGGAGIQADIKTITAHKLYAMSAITALTAQNTTGVYGVFEVSPEFVGKQLDCIFNDIHPDAVKIGMVSNEYIIEVIAEKLIAYGAKNIVVDPVMISTSGSRLINDNATEALKTKLLPIASVITPNIPEAEVLSGIMIKNKSDMNAACEYLSGLNKNILIKGGHLAYSADDLLFSNGQAYWFEEIKIDNQNTHGTGCTLSSAIACNLAMGFTILESINRAKAYITGALKSGLNLGKGSGPLNHCFDLG